MKKSEAKKGVEKPNNGGEMAEQRPSKSHQDYWKTRIFHPAFTRNGVRVTLPEYSVRIQYIGRRQEFALHTANAAAAAVKARDIYLKVVGAGWDIALAEYKPRKVEKPKVSTVGDFIAAVEKVIVVSPRSFHNYAYALRRIASDLTGLSKSTARLASHQTEAFKAWREKVDAVLLSKITPNKVAEWRTRFVASKKDPKDRRSAGITADSFIRNAKALFGKKIIPNIEKIVDLPDPLPFQGITLGKSVRRFRAEVSAEWLFLTANEELKLDEPEVWKALILCLLSGLRKREADCLMWDQIKLEDARIEIRRTKHFEPKTEESERDIDLTPETVEIIRQFKAGENPNPIFVLHGGVAKPNNSYEYYRANGTPWRTWTRLSRWLRSKGITNPKPIHDLRKLAGSLIHENFGVESARAFLGHSDIQTTSASYVDRKPRVAVTLKLKKPKAVEEEEAL